MTDRVQEFTDSLARFSTRPVKSVGRNADGEEQFRADCPVCNGKDQLYYSRGRIGDVVAQCMRGCAFIKVARTIDFHSNGKTRPDEGPLESLARRRRWKVSALEAMGCVADGDTVLFPMRDRTGATVSHRRRRADNQPFKMKDGRTCKALSERGKKLGLLGVWPVPEGDLLICEGEADVAAALSHGATAAVGTPGCNPGAIATEALKAIAPGRRVVLCPDPGPEGAKWLRKLGAALRPVAKEVLYVPPTDADLDDRLKAGASLADILATARPRRTPHDAAREVAGKLADTKLGDLAETVNGLLNSSSGREAKQAASGLVCKWFLDSGRLLADVSSGNTPAPYVLLPEGIAAPVNLEDGARRMSLFSVGLNQTEAAFRWAVADLESTAITAGRAINLARFACVKEGTLYVSSGSRAMVRARFDKDTGGVGLDLVPNGRDGVTFATDSCFPEWKPARQIDLLMTWLVCILANVRPLPILTMIGSHGGGKSTVATGIVRLFRGPCAKAVPAPVDGRDLQAVACYSVVHAIDNLDSELDGPLLDVLAAAATGAGMMQRKLHTNAQVVEMPTRAAFLATSRTGTFPQRADVGDRTLPLFFGPSPAMLIQDSALWGDVDRNRDGLLSWLADAACRAINAEPSQMGGGRFVAFNRVLPSLCEGEHDAPAILKAWQRAQRLSITDPDDLLFAILAHFQRADLGTPALSGTASEIVKYLAEHHDLNFQGGGKTLRES